MPFQSFASEQFWQLYSELPDEVQRLADQQYELFRQNPFHPSLHLKQSARFGPCASGDPIGLSASARRRHSPLELDRLARSMSRIRAMPATEWLKSPSWFRPAR